MYLHSIATSNPPRTFTQEFCWDEIRKQSLLSQLKPRSRDILEKILTNQTSGIEQRHLAIDSVESAFGQNAEDLNRRFEREAATLAGNALRKALEKSGHEITELDALFICTCTGYVCPGISSHVAEQTDMRADAFLADLVGLGCGAAVPLLRTAQGFTAANPNALVATIAVEVCSAAFFISDDPGVLVSLCLFGDGAAAAIWNGHASPDRWQLGNFSTVHHPANREKVRFINSGGRLKNQLHRSVPGLVAEAVPDLFALRSADPDQVIAHPGGRDVLDALENVLPFELTEAREVLRDHGNMSSPTVLFALEQRLAAAHPNDQRLWITAFGAGFSAHACELWR